MHRQCTPALLAALVSAHSMLHLNMHGRLGGEQFQCGSNGCKFQARPCFDRRRAALAGQGKAPYSRTAAIELVPPPFHSTNR